MKILGIGESVIDKTYITEGTKVPDDVVPDTHVGGPVLISMILLARLEHECSFITTIGRDDEAGIIIKTLYKENVLLFSEFKEKTKVNTILVNPVTGQRTKHRGNITHPDIQSLEPEIIRQFDIIIIDRHHKDAFFEVVKYKKPSAKIIIDPSTEISDFTLAMIKNADFPIIPIEALTKTEGDDLHTSLKNMYEVTKKPLIITAGELGSIVFNGQEMQLHPALAVHSVDTTGAGDIYRGAFAYGITQKWDIPQCVEYANCVAGIHCTKYGNAAAIPTKQEIDHCLAQKSNKKLLTEPTINRYFETL